MLVPAFSQNLPRTPALSWNNAIISQFGGLRGYGNPSACTTEYIKNSWKVVGRNQKGAPRLSLLSISLSECRTQPQSSNIISASGYKYLSTLWQGGGIRKVHIIHKSALHPDSSARMPQETWGVCLLFY